MLYASILAIGRMIGKRLRRLVALAHKSPDILLMVAATLLMVLICFLARS